MPRVPAVIGPSLRSPPAAPTAAAAVFSFSASTAATAAIGAAVACSGKGFTGVPMPPSPADSGDCSCSRHAVARCPPVCTTSACVNPALVFLLRCTVQRMRCACAHACRMVLSPASA